jgi:xanthine dehydrogenase accessory factor
MSDSIEPKSFGHSPLGVLSAYEYYRSLFAAQGTDAQWYLATVVNKVRSSYRQPGAFMLLNSLGQKFGLVSGGCIEAHLLQEARKLTENKPASLLTFDNDDEDNIAYALGMGCNGRIDVVLQTITPSLQTLLTTLHNHLTQGDSCELALCLEDAGEYTLGHAVLLTPTQQRPQEPEADPPYCSGSSDSSKRPAALAPAPGPLLQTLAQRRSGAPALQVRQESITWFVTSILPPPRLLILGGGIDAQPLVALATQLGWHVALNDHRPNNARRENFLIANSILRYKPNYYYQIMNPQGTEATHPTQRDISATDTPQPVQGVIAKADAILIMCHHVHLDAAWLATVTDSVTAPSYQRRFPYLGLLGPTHRKNRVLELAGAQAQALDERIKGPMGLDIGGDSPESVALSVVADIHRYLFAPEKATQ